MDMNNMGYQQQPYYNGYGYFPPNQPFMGQPVIMNGQPFMNYNNQNVLTNEEIKELQNKGIKNNVIDLNVEQVDVYRAMCTHKYNGRDVVQLINDGSGEVYCPICGERWNPEATTKDVVTDHVKQIINDIQNFKWASTRIPANVMREFATILIMLWKFPELFEYGIGDFNRLVKLNGMYGANDANPLAQYDSLFIPNYGMYQQPNYGMYQQPMNPYQPNMNNMGYQQPQMATPDVNPMQQPYYGQPGYNPQFGNQANMMMNGGYYAQQPQGPGPQINQFVPQFGNAAMPPQQPPMNAQQPPQAPQAPNNGQQPPQAPPAAEPATVTTETKVDL